MLDLGKIYLQAGNYAEARAQFSRALDNNSNNKEAWGLLGITAILSGNFPEGDAYFRKLSIATDEIIEQIVNVLSLGGRDITSEFVTLDKTILQKHSTSYYPSTLYYPWRSIIQRSLGKIINLKTPPIFESLVLEEIDYMNSPSFEFVLSYYDYQDYDYKRDHWVIQIFSDLSGCDLPNFNGRIAPQLSRDKTNNWRTVNLKIPPRKNEEVYGLIETAYIIPKDVKISPETAIQNGFHFHRWQLLSMNGLSWPTCYQNIIEEYAPKNELEEWAKHVRFIEEERKLGKIFENNSKK